MSLAQGELLFYGGIAGLVIAAVITIIVIVVLSGSRKKLRRKLDEEYGPGKK